MYASGTEDAYQTYGPSGLDVAEFIGLEVNSSTTDADVANYVSTYNVGFPICNNISPTAINYQLYYTPSYYVIYPDSTYATFCPVDCQQTSSSSTIEGLINTAIQSWLPPVYGCTDADAVNYDSNATADDGTCDFTSYTIKTLGMSFSPDTIMCDVGDTINFVLGGYHNAIEVSQTTFLALGNTSNGGFSFGYGATGSFIPTTAQTYYYVCQPHASGGMKGVIIAQQTAVLGCTDSVSCNYDPNATVDDGSCYGVLGCMDPLATNYNSVACIDDGSCIYYTCADAAPTGLSSTNIIHDRATISWDNMNSAATVPTTHYIHAGNYYYTPSSLSINEGDTVVWINDGGYHNVNFNISAVTGQSYNNPESFVTNPTTSANMASYVFTVPGNYTYDCSVGSHAANGMIGSIQLNPASTCVVDQYRIKYREQGTTAWSSKTMGAPVGSCNFGTNKTDKLLLNLSPNTTYEYQMKAWYCGGGASAWTSLHNFTTLGECPNVSNLQVSTPTTTKATFTWNTTAAYSFVRIKARVDITGSAWFNVGGFGVNYPTLTKNKNGLTPGTSYRAQGRTWCDPSGGAYRSTTWTHLVFWTQPAVVRLADANLTERTLLRITDLLGREVNPDDVIDKTTLLYIYDDGIVEKMIIIE